MTTRTWNGTTADFGTAADWSPAGVPTSGDTAVINSGTVTVTGTELAPNVAVNATATTGNTPLILTAASIAAGDVITATATGASPTNIAAAIGVIGSVTNNGTVVLAQNGGNNPAIGFVDAPGGGASTFVNNGNIVVTDALAVVVNAGSNAGSSVVNNGHILLSNDTTSPNLLRLQVPMSGTGGIIRVGAGVTFEATGGISGQDIYLQGVSGKAAVVEFDNSAANSNTIISNFTASDQLIITTPVFNSTGLTTANGNTTVSFAENGTAVGSFTLQGTYSASQINLQTVTPQSGVGLETFVSTTVADNTIGANYRFLDTTYGTHLFTQSLQEAQTILQTRPDLRQETNTFGSVNPASNDPDAITVYRFNETNNGTHFFTASATEAQAIQTQGSGDYQPNFTYEQASNFLEDSVAAPGDTPVYRFLDHSNGTQFLTGSTTEAQAVQTPNSGDYQPNFSYEGIAFYAPAGTFHT